MKVQLEEIRPDADSSFRLLVTPKLHDFFFWHFHPEYELVYIEAGEGTRHVGEHMSRFQESDLVLIGPYIPHLNFDYGIKTDYEQFVLQMREDFLSGAFNNIPELASIHKLFEKARHGVYFSGDTRQAIGPRLKRLHMLQPYEQFIEILNIFQELATSPGQGLLHSRPVEQLYSQKEQQRLKRVYAFIEAHYQDAISVDQMAELTHLTKAAFCRYFKKMTLMTFTEFLNQYRISQAKRLLLLDKTVTEVCFDCGFESLSYFNRTFKKVAGENPLHFKKRHRLVLADFTSDKS
ncbi:AraC family transcriptional regulator [Nibrella saemangeumensis]|uniref:AraC family transcriptional regulator n=1 Tax=Nibrella saemangeumensis TaxID=1084526 RepID=A0ABP8MVL4_9BACT